MYYADGYPASNFFAINETTGEVYVKDNLQQDTEPREFYRVCRYLQDFATSNVF